MTPDDLRHRARRTVRGRLAAAMRRERLTPADVRDSPLAGAFEAELTDAEEKLALAYARRAAADARARADASHAGAGDILALIAGQRPDDQVVRLEQLATQGHNLHPCGRTRLGWSPGDAMAHDLESAGTEIGFVGVPVAAHVGDDLGERLGVAAPRGHRAQPVHAWQLGVVRERYPDLPVLGQRLSGRVTAAVRTLWVAERDTYLKLSLDVQITSTRRTISTASTRNGPLLSGVLPSLLAECAGERVELLTEPAGAAASLGSGRDLSAILRQPLPPLGPAEFAVPAVALSATCPISGVPVIELVRRRSGLAAGEFLAAYAGLLLPPVLGMAARYGVGLEAHLQNCIVTFAGGRPRRLILRDLAGLRLHAGRLADAGISVPLWPGSVVGTHDEGVLLSKVAYTALQAHLGEVVRCLRLPEGRAWALVRGIVDEVYDGLSVYVPVAAKADHAFLTAPAVPHKALVRMRLAGDGDIYVPMDNPLHGAS
jgi:siderophore synthetase component